MNGAGHPTPIAARARYRIECGLWLRPGIWMTREGPRLTNLALQGAVGTVDSRNISGNPQEKDRKVSEITIRPDTL